MFLSTALLFMLSASFSMAEVGQPLLHRSNDAGPARFFWKMAYSDTRNLVLIHSPSDKEVFHFNGNKSYSASSHYKSRVANVSVTDDAVTFALKAVTQADAGNYFCRENDHAGPFIHDCGQYLYYLDENTVPVLPDKCLPVTRDEGQTVNLICVVEFSSLPVPGKGYTWTFSASDSDAGRPLKETGVTLTLSSLSRDHTGSYSCAVREDPTYTGRTSGKSSIHLTVMDSPPVSPPPSASPGSPPVSPPTSATPPVGPQSDCSSCPDAYKTPFIVVMVLLGVAALAVIVIAICYKLKYIEIKFLCCVPRTDDRHGAPNQEGMPLGNRPRVQEDAMGENNEGGGDQPAGVGAAEDVPDAGHGPSSQRRRQDERDKGKEEELERLSGNKQQADQQQK